MTKYRLALINEHDTVLESTEFMPVNECPHHEGSACSDIECGQFVLIGWAAQYHGLRGVVGGPVTCGCIDYDTCQHG